MFAFRSLGGGDIGEGESLSLDRTLRSARVVCGVRFTQDFRSFGSGGELLSRVLKRSSRRL